jgi:hypothetical protein
MLYIKLKRGNEKNYGIYCIFYLSLPFSSASDLLKTRFYIVQRYDETVVMNICAGILKKIYGG